MIKSKKADYNKVLLIFFILITLVMFSLVFFNKGNNNAIQIWIYLDEATYTGNSKGSLDKYIKEIKQLCEDKGIEVEWNIWGEPVKKPISYEQYILKRNIAMADGNFITFTNLNDTELYEIKDMCLDYTTIDNYKNLWEPAQGKFYIPLYFEPTTYVSDTRLFDSYDISTDQNFLTFQEYVQKVGQLVENGADLKLNTTFYYYLIEYYKMKNNISLLDDDVSIIDNKDIFSEGIANTICTMLDELDKFEIKNKNDYVNFVTSLSILRARGEMYDLNDVIYDYNTNEQIKNNKSVILDLYKSLMRLKLRDEENIFVYCSDFVPGTVMFIYNKVTNNGIYEIANKLLYNIKFDYNAYIPKLLEEPKRPNEEFTLQYLEFIKWNNLPTENIPAFRQHHSLSWNYKYNPPIKRNLALIAQENAFSTFYFDRKRSSDLMKATNAKSYVNIQIDDYIKNTIFKYITSNNTEVINKNEMYDIQKANAEEFISKLSIYSK